MKKIVDDERLIYRCCSLYYEENMGQLEIAKYLGISKSSVSRILQTGRDLGIVEIKVHHISQYMYDDIAEEVKKKYHLRDVVVAESSPLDSKEERISKLNERAADYLNRLIQDGDYVGVSVGTSLYNVAHTKQTYTKRNCTFVPIVGGISQHDTQMKEMQSNQIAAAMAEKFGGNCVSFFSPAIFSNKKLMEAFLKEDSVNFIFEYFKKMNTVIVGMGIFSHNFEFIEKSRYVSPEVLEDIRNRGAVCNYNLRFLDANGDDQPFADFNEKVAAISSEDHKNIRNKILITGGNVNLNALKSSIRGGYANILIIDVDCAKKLLAQERGKNDEMENKN